MKKMIAECNGIRQTDEFTELSIPTKLTNPKINRLTYLDYLSQFLLQSVPTSFITSSAIEFIEHSIPNKLNRSNKPFKMFRHPLAIPSSWCYDKLSKFFRH